MVAQVLSSEDVRFNAPLYTACQSFIPKMCHDVVPADDWVWDPTQQQSGNSPKSKAKDTTDMTTSHGKVLNCLIQHRNNIMQFVHDQPSDSGALGIESGSRSSSVDASKCQEQVTAAMASIATDLRLNPKLHDDCYEDQQYFCARVNPGFGTVHACLRAHLEFLKPNCRRAEFDELALESESLDFKIKLQAACATETVHLCRGVPKPKLVRCLQDHVGAPEMGEACRVAIHEDEKLEFRYASLNPELLAACGQDSVAEQQCDLHPGNNRVDVYPCLKEHVGEMTSELCKTEIRRVMEKQVGAATYVYVIVHLTRLLCTSSHTRWQIF